MELEEFSERCAYEAALWLLTRKRRIDAIYCVSDLFALGVVHAGRELGVAVPQELGVIGVGDSPLSRGMTVPLSSVRVYPELAGVRLLESLIAMIEDPAVVPELRAESLPGELIVRESTSRI